MGNRKNHIAAHILMYAAIKCTNAVDQNWFLGPFSRLDSENPILEARMDTSFNCPLQGRAVKWESKDVFNPSAVVREGQVNLLYRAEDRDGNLAGTSRIGNISLFSNN